MYEVNTTNCTGCAACIEICPFDAIFMVDNKAQIDETKCRECRQCLDVCPKGAIVVSYESVPVSAPIYAKKSDTVPIHSNTNGQVTQKVGVWSHVMDFFNRILVPHNEWFQKDIPRKYHSQDILQRKLTNSIGSRGRCKHRVGRGLGRQKRARASRW